MAATNPDGLTREEYAREIGYALNVVFSNPDLRELFKKAYKQNWTEDEFATQVRGTDWYKNNSQYAREAWVVYQTGGADAEAYQQNARLAVQAAATRLGRRLSEQELNQLATRYNNEGWGVSGRQQLLDTALSQGLTADAHGNLLGSSGNLQEDLQQIAQRNGVGFSNSYYISAARSVAQGLSTPEDWERDIRQMAASLYPTLADKINAGLDVKDIASSYINTMAQIFEMDPDQINLSDPHIKAALGAADEQGNPRTMGLWEFEKSLREDPRWMGTKQAVDSYSSMAMDFLKRFGRVG